ncbi:MAG TPA: F0F1 ATP synthase subunit alpha, partial [Candidatus Jacksonbacteria bacterium]|nr:F0F1 ATP synthase subunit alpha [Candidatus Jacksonbacteria bacterium]
FAQFSSDLDATTKKRIELGKRIVEILKQKQYAPFPVENQVAVIYAVTNGYLDEVAVDKVSAWEAAFNKFLASDKSGMLETIRAGEKLDEATEKKLVAAITTFNTKGLW